MIPLHNFYKSCKTRQKPAAELVKGKEPDRILGGVKSVTKHTRIFVLLVILQKLGMEKKFNAPGSTLSASSATRSEASGALLLQISQTQLMSSGLLAG
jgi:hypothetical protein